MPHGFQCRDCYNEYNRKYSRQYHKEHPGWSAAQSRLYQARHPKWQLLHHAKKRAQAKGKPFSISEKDFEIPKTCPILGIPLFKGDKVMCRNSPTLDEIIVGKGYIPGNVQILSYKANTMKSDATVKELLKFSEWVQKTYGTKRLPKRGTTSRS